MKQEPYLKVKLLLLLVSPSIFILIPTSFFEHSPTVCPYKLLTGNNCPGCGITRAISSAAHLEFDEAWQYNRLFVIVLPLLIYLYINQVTKTFKSLQKTQKTRIKTNLKLRT